MSSVRRKDDCDPTDGAGRVDAVSCDPARSPVLVTFGFYLALGDPIDPVTGAVSVLVGGGVLGCVTFERTPFVTTVGTVGRALVFFSALLLRSSVRTSLWHCSRAGRSRRPSIRETKPFSRTPIVRRTLDDTSTAHPRLLCRVGRPSRRRAVQSDRSRIRRLRVPPRSKRVKPSTLSCGSVRR